MNDSFFYETKENDIDFRETKKGRPLSNGEPKNKVKKVFFTQTELIELENIYTNSDYSSFSLFLKSLIEKGLKC